MLEYTTSLLTSRPISVRSMSWRHGIECLAWLQGMSRRARNEHPPPYFSPGFLWHAFNHCFWLVSFQDMIISGLQPETSYSLTVTAYTTKGDGARSKPKLVSTTGAGNVFYAHLYLQPYVRRSSSMDVIYVCFFIMIHWGKRDCTQPWS